MGWINGFVNWVNASPTAQSLISIADLIGKFAIIYAIASYLIEIPDRKKQQYYQAWEVINSARSSPGDGGRRAAILDLMELKNDLRGVDLNNATIESFDLRGVAMPEAHFNNASIVKTLFSCKPPRMPMLQDCEKADLTSAFFGADQAGSGPASVYLSDNRFDGSKMPGAILQNAILERNVFDGANLTGAYFSAVTFNRSNSFKSANLTGAHLSHIQFDAIGDSTTKNVDFTDATLIGVTWNGNPVSPEDLRPELFRLCRTKFSDQMSERDC